MLGINEKLIENSISFEKLWENSNTEINFESQNVELPDLSNYKFLMILFYSWNRNKGIQTVIIPCIDGTSANLDCTIFANSTMHFGTRLAKVDVTNNKIYFDTNHGWVSTTGVNVDDAWNVPYQIYGLKIPLK